ncbi:MAG: Diaminopimelate decarboxylase [Bacteroidota bacterium]|jgi:diaminopimelate decarboxylase
MISNELMLKAASEFGLPLYLYDTQKMQLQYKHLKTELGEQVKFFYACKALSNINVLKHFQQMGSGLDCVSINEVKLGLKAGFAISKIIFTPNSVAFVEIEEAMQLGVHINIDSITILEQFGNKYHNTYPVCVRFNPHIMAGGNYKISTGHVDSKFGISIHQLRHVERLVKTLNINVQGLHMHTGSEIKDVNVFKSGLEIMFDLATHFPEIKFVDLGSGFKVPYKPDEEGTDIKALSKILADALTEFKTETGKDIEIWFEPGKYLVSESGYFLVSANIIKHTTATVFVGVNSGFNHLIRPMFYDSYHHIENISNIDGAQRIYTVVGNICETDTFAWDRKINEVHEGDVLCFKNAGAYGFEMSSNFNSRFKPAEAWLHNGKLQLIRERDVFEDLLRKQIEVI